MRATKKTENVVLTANQNDIEIMERPTITHP